MTLDQAVRMYLSEANRFRAEARDHLKECAAEKDRARRRELARLAAAELHIAAQCRKDAARLRAA